MPRHILIIEDHPANLELMVYLLRAAGHICSVATDGEAGVQAAARERPDLILCDIAMPVLDGYGVVARLAADAALREIPVIAVTASAMVGDRAAVLARGFTGYVSKPITPERFVADIEAFLETRS